MVAFEWGCGSVFGKTETYFRNKMVWEISGDRYIHSECIYQLFSFFIVGYEVEWEIDIVWSKINDLNQEQNKNPQKKLLCVSAIGTNTCWIMKSDYIPFLKMQIILMNNMHKTLVEITVPENILIWCMNQISRDEIKIEQNNNAQSTQCIHIFEKYFGIILSEFIDTIRYLHIKGIKLITKIQQNVSEINVRKIHKTPIFPLLIFIQTKLSSKVI